MSNDSEIALPVEVIVDMAKEEKEVPPPRSWLKTIVMGALKLRVSLEI